MLNVTDKHVLYNSNQWQENLKILTIKLNILEKVHVNSFDLTIPCGMHRSSLVPHLQVLSTDNEKEQK